MKKIISMIAVFAMLLALCACGGNAQGVNGDQGNDASSKSSFMVGYGKVDITPVEYGISMSGYGNQTTRLSTGLLSYIYAIAVAVTDADGNTAILMSLDMCNLGGALCTQMRDWIKVNLGIPTENVIISSIHQHSTPDPDYATDYAKDLLEGMQEAVTQALDDRAEAEMYINKVETDALSFLRRYWGNDGGFISSHSGDRSSGYARYESDPDKEMRLIKFVRKDKKPVIMVNFQGHPHMGTDGSSTTIHSDWPGVMRDVVEEELKAQCIYFSGAGANLNSSTPITEDIVSADFREHGQRAAQYVIGAEDSYTKAETGAVVCVEQNQLYETDHSLDHLLDAAKAVDNVRKNKGMSAAHQKVKEFPELNSAYQATAIVNKAVSGQTKALNFSVITFGDVAIAGQSYEMFDTNGKDLRDGTVGNEFYAAEDQLENPFPMTFVATLTNAGNGYIPSYTGFANGGYERDITRYAQGTGELIVGDVLHVLNDLR